MFWALVQKAGLTPAAAQERLKGSLAGQKNEILFSEFGVNYNNEAAQFRKGTTIIKKKVEVGTEADSKLRSKILELDCDIIGEEFWTENPHLLRPFLTSCD